jgi:hypothetical protein
LPTTENSLHRSRDGTKRKRQGRAWPRLAIGEEGRQCRMAHLNARDTTLAFVSRAPQADIVRLKARIG